jgi:hypothetical protein
MANRTAALYIRTKTGYKKHGKRLSDLPEGEAYQLFWYVGSRKKAKAVGRFADGAQAASSTKRLNFVVRPSWAQHLKRSQPRAAVLNSPSSST